MIILRDYQQRLIDDTFAAWDAGHRNVLVQSHTGSGKTVILTEIVRRANTPTVIIAHRIELVSQLSLALARAGIVHDIMSPSAAVSSIIQLHLQDLSRHYYNPCADILVASVDTLVRQLPGWRHNIKLAVVDEAAHVLRDNKWGKTLDMFSSARKLLVTATPMRADGKGLGTQGKGIAEVLIEGPSMRELIQQGYLSPYRIFAPPNNLDLSPVKIGASGDYSPDPLRAAVKKAQITGDVVEHYLRHGGGRGITFAVSVEAAHELAAAYCAAQIPAVCLHAGTEIGERAAVMRQFREGNIKQLVNVDILAEGVDVPAVSCVSLCRPTASYSLHMQQLGRSLRLAEGKPYAIILDHVGNVTKHGLPDTPRIWTLESQDRKSRGAPGGIPLRTCLNPTCVAVFERNLDRCPYCKHPIPLPKERSMPEQVEGNLIELLPEVNKKIREEIARIEGAPRIPHGVSGIIAASIVKKHHARQDAQKELQKTIADWAGKWHAQGESDSEIHRRFYFNFGMDILTAQTLSTVEMRGVIEKINPSLSTLIAQPIKIHSDLYRLNNDEIHKNESATSSFKNLDLDIRDIERWGPTPVCQYLHTQDITLRGVRYVLIKRILEFIEMWRNEGESDLFIYERIFNVCHDDLYKIMRLREYETYKVISSLEVILDKMRYFKYGNGRPIKKTEG